MEVFSHGAVVSKHLRGVFDHNCHHDDIAGNEEYHQFKKRLELVLRKAIVHNFFWGHMMMIYLGAPFVRAGNGSAHFLLSLLLRFYPDHKGDDDDD